MVFFHRVTIPAFLTLSFFELRAITIFNFFIAWVNLRLRARARPMHTQNASAV